jgi:protein-tyrosine-phosphatase
VSSPEVVEDAAVETDAPGGGEAASDARGSTDAPPASPNELLHRFATETTPHRFSAADQDRRSMGQHEFERFAEDALQLRLDAAGTRLAEEFEGIYDRDTIRATVEESARVLSVKGVTPYVHILAERFTRERLTAQAQSEGRIAKSATEIVFVSLTGGGRAQMGAALLARRTPDAVAVHCAGSDAGTEIDEHVRTALSEVGIDPSEAYIRPLTTEVLAGADVVVTMGRSVGEVAIPGSARHLDWRVGDPAGAELDEVRRVRDDIARRVEALADELTGKAASPGQT